MGLTDIFRTNYKTQTSQKWDVAYLPKTLVVATDFSVSAQHALEVGLKMFLPAVERVVLVNVYNVPNISIGSLVTVKDILYQLADEGLDQQEQFVAERLDGKEVAIERVCRTGALAETLAEICSQAKDPLIFMGNTGASEVPGVYQGQKRTILLNALENVPIMSVPRTWSYKQPKNILYTSDINELEHINNLDYLVGIALAYDANVHVVHVSERNILQSFSVSAADRDLMPVYQDLYPEVSFTYRNLNGVDPIYDQIDGLVKEKDIDMCFTVLQDNGFYNDLFNSELKEKDTFFNRMPVISLRK